jgi:hypothetical protein
MGMPDPCSPSGFSFQSHVGVILDQRAVLEFLDVLVCAERADRPAGDRISPNYVARG